MAPHIESELLEVSYLDPPNIVKSLGLSPNNWKTSYGIPSETEIPLSKASLLLVEPQRWSEYDVSLDCFRVGEGEAIGRVSIKPLTTTEAGSKITSDGVGNHVKVSAVNPISSPDIVVETRINRATPDDEGFEEIIVWDNNKKIFGRASAGDRLTTKGGIVLIPRFRRLEKGIVYILPITEFINKGEGLRQMREILSKPIAG